MRGPRGTKQRRADYICWNHCQSDRIKQFYQTNEPFIKPYSLWNGLQIGSHKSLKGFHISRHGTAAWGLIYSICSYIYIWMYCSDSSSYCTTVYVELGFYIIGGKTTPGKSGLNIAKNSNRKSYTCKWVIITEIHFNQVSIKQG